MKRARRHWHVIVDAAGRPTVAVIEHDHPTNPGRRHVHRYDYEGVLRSQLAQGIARDQAKARARYLEGRPEGSLDLDRMPEPALDERTVTHSLHPELRRDLA